MWSKFCSICMMADVLKVLKDVVTAELVEWQWAVKDTVTSKHHRCSTLVYH
jgi:hypothetical protein